MRAVALCGGNGEAELSLFLEDDGGVHAGDAEGLQSRDGSGDGADEEQGRDEDERTEGDTMRVGGQDLDRKSVV